MDQINQDCYTRIALVTYGIKLYYPCIFIKIRIFHIAMQVDHLNIIKNLEEFSKGVDYQLKKVEISNFQNSLVLKYDIFIQLMYLLSFYR